MRIWAAYSTVRDETGKIVQERDAFKCCHCPGHEIVVPGQTEFEFCTNCDDGNGGGLVCKRCRGKPCVHFMKKIEREEAECLNRIRFWREADNV